MSFLEDFNYDSDKGKNGVWFDEEGSRFLIAHVPELDFLKMVSREVDKIKAKSKLKDKEITQSQSLDITLNLVVKHRLLDWDVTKENGDKLEYSPEKAVEMLTVSSRFRNWVAEKSGNLTNYYEGERKERVKK